MPEAAQPEFRDWQKRAWKMIQERKEVCIVGCRGAGKDFLLQWFVLLALEQGDDVVILSLSERQNKKFIRQLRKMVKALDRDGVVSFPLDTDSVLEVSHATSGGTLTALTSVPENLQGYHCHVILNELGANDNDIEEILSQAMSATSSEDRYRLIISTNATEPGHWLDRMLHDEGARWEAWRNDLQPYLVRISDVYPQLPEHLERQKLRMLPHHWARWYECEFAGFGGSVISQARLRELQFPDCSRYTRHVAGVDVGAVQDPTAIVVLGLNSRGQWVVRHSESRWRVPLAAQPTAIKERVAAYRVRKYVLDQSGIGYSIAQALQLDQRCVPTTYSPTFYSRSVEKLQTMAADGSIIIPPEFELLRAQIAAAQVDDKGRVTKPYDKWGNERTHCDELDALLGAVMVAEGNPVGFDLNAAGGLGTAGPGPGIQGGDVPVDMGSLPSL